MQSSTSAERVQKGQSELAKFCRSTLGLLGWHTESPKHWLAEVLVPEGHRLLRRQHRASRCQVNSTTASAAVCGCCDGASARMSISARLYEKSTNKKTYLRAPGGGGSIAGLSSGSSAYTGSVAGAPAARHAGQKYCHELARWAPAAPCIRAASALHPCWHLRHNAV